MSSQSKEKTKKPDVDYNFINPFSEFANNNQNEVNKGNFI